MRARLVARYDGDCSCVQMERVSANPGTAAGEAAQTSLPVLVDRQ
jgi:hypothetical protein